MKAKLKTLFLVLLALGAMAMFSWISFLGARNATAVLRARDTRVELTATITGAKRYVEVDEGVDREYWHAQVSYTYNGVDYRNVHYDRQDNPPTIGKVVTVSIDPANPGELLPDGVEVGLSVLLSPLFLMGVTAALYHLLKWMLTTRLRGGEATAGVVAAVFAVCTLVAESLIYYLQHDSAVFAVFSLVALGGIALLCGVSAYRQKKSSKKE